MPLPRWTLFSPLVIIMVAGLTVRCHPHPPHRPKTGGGKSASAPDLAVQSAHSPDAAPASSAAARDAVYGPPAPLARTLSPAGEGATAASLAVSGGMGGGVLRDRDADSGSGATWPDGRAAKSGRSGHGGKSSRDAEEESDATGEGGTRWASPHYAPWTPAAVYGPPCPPERMRVRQQAHRLLQDMEAGRLEVMISERDGEQLRCLERDGVYGWPAPPPGVAVRSPRQRDVLEGTIEAGGASFASPDAALNGRSYARNNAAGGTHADLTLASRGLLPRRAPTVNSTADPNISTANPIINPADDPDFDPCLLPPAPGLLRMLTTLAAHSTSARPLCVMSLLRPPYRMGDFVHVGPANPHSLGLAVDIAAYGGYGIRQSNPEQCVRATLALLRDLPPGRYRMGMPKAPEGGWELPPALSALLRRAETGDSVSSASISSEANSSGAKGEPSASGSKGTAAKSAPGAERSAAASPALALAPYTGRSSDTRAEQAQAATERTEEATGCATAALYGLHASRAKPAWPFFPPPYFALSELAPPDDFGAPAVETGLRSTAKPILRFQNEAYAPENALADPRLLRALQKARQRGVDVVALFPDGADHIHLDVRQNP